MAVLPQHSAEHTCCAASPPPRLPAPPAPRPPSPHRFSGELSPAMGRRRPARVVTPPAARAAALVLSSHLATPLKRARKLSISFCGAASGGGTPGIESRVPHCMQISAAAAAAAAAAVSDDACLGRGDGDAQPARALLRHAKCSYSINDGVAYTLCLLSVSGADKCHITCQEGGQVALGEASRVSVLANSQLSASRGRIPRWVARVLWQRQSLTAAEPGRGDEAEGVARGARLA